MAEVRKVKKIKQARIPAQAGAGPDELIPDELESLDELEDLESLDELEDLESLDDIPQQVNFQEIVKDGPADELPISTRDRDRMAQEALQQSRREVEINRMEKQSGRKKRKVRDPKAELYASLTVIIITALIASVFFYIANEDYKGDAASSYDTITYDNLREEKETWYFPHNNTITHDNATGSFTGKDAAVDYKEAHRMDGPYAREYPFGPITFELNWVYYFIIGLLVLTGPNGIMRRNAINRLKAKEGKFPDFIRDLAEFWKGGLSMTVAIDTLSKGDYGALDEEVEFMATQFSWGVAFNDVLDMFLERVHTGLIERSIALIEEANKAGGKISDILLNVAHDAQEIKMLDRQREGTMKSYIFVTFISFLIYVIIIVIMSYVFLPAIADSTEDLDIEGGGIGAVQIQSFDPTFIALIFFSSVIVQSIGGGVNAGLMGEGNLGAGLWYITLFTLTGVAIFQLFGVHLGLG